MSLTKKSKLRDVNGISETEKALIKAFLQGAIYCWVKNRKGEQFAARDLMGSENFEWKGTPLFVLYKKHKNGGKDHKSALKSAAKDLGWLMKAVLADDKRTFKVSKSGLVNSYCWIGNEA